jgi:YVTN family beta-propeller protein
MFLSKLFPISALSAAVLLTGCRYHDFPDYPSNYREYAYVSNLGGNTVTALDLVDLRLDRVIAVGQQPTDVAVNSKKNEVYIVNRQPSGNGSVSVINAEKNQVAATIGVHRLPTSIAVENAGHRAYVVNSGSNNVSVIDLDARREIAALPTGQQPAKVRVSPDDRTVAVTNRNDGSVALYSARTNAQHPLELRTIIYGCPGADDMAILPDSSKIFVACAAGHQVMSVALAQPSESYAVRQQGAPTHDHQLVLLDVGKTPMHLAMKKDGGEIFAINYDGDSISEIATENDEVGGTYFIGSKPSFGIVSSDDSTLWVSNFGSDAVTAYVIDDGKIDTSIRTGSAPTAMAFTSKGHLLMAIDSHSGDVSIIRTVAHDQYTGRSLLTLLPAGAQPSAVAVKSFLLK